MLNVHSAGKEPYLIASPQKPRTFSDELILYLVVLVDVLKLIVLTVFEVLKLPFTVCLKSGQKVINGQNALITGGGNGIGRAIALELAQNGCNVIIADVDEKAAEKTLDMLKEFDVKAIAITTDVSNPKEVENLKEAIADSLESVDILVNNAGLMPLISLREGAPVDVERIVDVNLNANFWTVRAFLPDMIKKRRGHIVQISSMSALHPIAGGCIYTATKFAVNGFMQALEEEMRQEGLGDCIDFTTVFPYFVSTRRDLMNVLNLRFPAITVQQVAEATVRGVFSRQRRVTVPCFDGLLTTFVQSLPHAVQCLIRDYVMREPEARVIKNPYLYVD